jgi:general secretion pathway protein B
MSLILDALKKSDNERQRHGQPAMFEIKVAPPRARFPVWALLLGLLLGINLIVLLVVLVLREPTAAPAPVDASNPAADVQASQAAATLAPPASALPATAPPASAPIVSTPVATGPQAASGAASRFNPPLVEDPDLDAEVTGEVAANPNGILPAAPAALPPAPPLRAGGGVVAGLPDRAALVAAGTAVPEVKVSLHAWDRDPAARFVFVDGARAGEGTLLPSGVRVEQITQDGTVLSYRGSRFLVPIQ